jgi:hypothetical protein
VPRNVVRLSPRLDLFGRKRQKRSRVLAALRERYRFREVETWVEIDFPRRAGTAARAEVVAELDRIDPKWRRLFQLYPRD